jgi:general transcription factor 3C polypeptide 3 (transcription factor C subunit 4)
VSLSINSILLRTDDKMDVDEDFVEGLSDENSDGLEQNSEEDAEGEEDEENEDDAPNPEEMYAEKRLKEISSGHFSITHHSADQNNLSHLVQSIRLRDMALNSGASGSGFTVDWDFSIEEKEAEFCDDLREATGIGQKRKWVSELA